jgi:phosphoribosyl-AMP cyclohydrolase
MSTSTPAAATTARFAARVSVEQVEEGRELAPKFDANGLIPVVTSDAKSGEVLMMGTMNAEALVRTIETGEAHYWSRSRRTLWRKGASSGLVQRVMEMRVDDDQDAIWLRVEVLGAGASCHVGYRSCFYRAIPVGAPAQAGMALTFTEDRKVFDPAEVYGDAPNPTQL